MSNIFFDYYTEVLSDSTLDNVAIADLMLLKMDLYSGAEKDRLIGVSVGHLLRGGDYERVIEYSSKYLTLVTTDQYHTELYRYWIEALEKTKRWEEAIALRRKMTEELKYGCMYDGVAEAYEEAGEIDNALLYYDKHLIEEEGYMESETMERIAKIYEDKGDFANSARYLLAAAKNECSGSAYLWQNTGRALAMANKEEEALKYFEIALILEPDSENTLYCIGHVYQNKGDTYMAMHYYTQVLKMNPFNAMVYNNLGAMAFNDEGDIKGSIEKIETALEMNEDPQLKLTMHINLARLYHKISDYDKHNHHKMKIFEAAGFGGVFDDEDDDEDDDDDEDEEEEEA